MRSDARRVGHAEGKEKKKQRPFGLEWKAEAREPLSAICVSSRKIKTQKESFSLRGAVRKDREKHNESVRE